MSWAGQLQEFWQLDTKSGQAPCLGWVQSGSAFLLPANSNDQASGTLNRTHFLSNGSWSITRTSQQGTWIRRGSSRKLGGIWLRDNWVRDNGSFARERRKRRVLQFRDSWKTHQFFLLHANGRSENCVGTIYSVICQYKVICQLFSILLPVCLEGFFGQTWDQQQTWPNPSPFFYLLAIVSVTAYTCLLLAVWI